jgi:hypothetical protein
MQKSILLVLLICSICASHAQDRCDSLYGKWVFTRWQTDNLFLDIEDSAATIHNKFKKYQEGNNGASLSKADSLKLIAGLNEILEIIRTNGFMSFTLKKDKTFDWKGTVNDPNAAFSGVYSCKGDSIVFVGKVVSTDSDNEQIPLKVISFTRDTLTVGFPASSDSNFSNSRMSFKRVR